MELETLIGLVNNPAELIPKLLKGFKPLFEVEAWKNYDVLFHNVNNQFKRPNKQVQKPSGSKSTDGEDILENHSVAVNRIAIPFQRFIVETSATFLTGGTIDIKAATDGDATKEDILSAIKTYWTNNKLQYKTGQIAEFMMSELEVAELWFSDEQVTKDENGKETTTTVMKCNILAPSMGYTLQPIFDGICDLIAFGITYTKDKVQYYDLYTDKELRRHSKDGKNWALIGGILEDGSSPGIIPLPYGKIPIIYYSQPRSEWYDVQSMIERLETMASNHGDTNDYSGSPILFVQGALKGFADKGEPGKVIVGEKDTTVQYVTPQSAPESMKLEYENLKSLIHLFTAAPDLSLQSLKGLGQVPSGSAFERLLLATYMKAIRRQTGTFGESMQRRVNFLEAAAAVVNPKLAPAANMNIELVYNLFKLDDLVDKINAWMAANGNKPLISHEESIAAANLTEDSTATYDKIKADESAVGNILNPSNA